MEKIFVIAVSGAVGQQQQQLPLHTTAQIGGHRDVQCPTIAMWLAIKILRDELASTDEDALFSGHEGRMGHHNMLADG